MSETKWISYEEERDKRPERAARPKVKHIRIYNNYPLAQLYGSMQLISVIFSGLFLGQMIYSDSSPVQTEVYLLKTVLSFCSWLAFSILYNHAGEHEEFIEDLQ
jgi:hypothetical protein